MPELLKKSYRDQLVTWIGKPCHFQLLYKISRDGCSAPTFHQQCDGKGATVTVFYNTNNTIYGGYLSQSWNSSGYISDSKAFLFRLQYNGSFNPLKFPVSDASKAGHGSGSYGPIFGSGQDIQSFSGQVKCSGKVFTLNGYFGSLGSGYNLNGQNVNTITNNSLNVTDMEVYLVKDGQKQDKPWREHLEWTSETLQELKRTLLDYTPMTETNVPAANILLIGQTGTGKSSFFNSINSIFRGKITSKAVTGRFEHSVTTMYRQYELKDIATKKVLNFRLCDTVGFQEQFAFDSQEFAFILCGNLPDCYQFNPLLPFSPDTPGCIKDPDLKDKIHCVAFVIDGSTMGVMSDPIQKQIKDLQVRVNYRGLPQAVLLTNIDKICPDVDDDVTNTFTSTAVCEAVNKAAEITGLSRDHVFPVKNYESERTLKTPMDILLMEALKQCLDFADEYMDEQLHRVATEKQKHLAKV